MRKILIITFILINGCYKENLLAPKTYIIKGPKSGSTVYNNTLIIKWNGIGCDYFQYSIDNKNSDWTKEDSIYLILDDGWHTFWVRGINLLEEKEKDFPYIYFYVDGIRNGFTVFPIYDSVKLDEEINVSISAEKLNSHNFEYIKLVWTNGLTLVEYNIDSTVFSSGSIPTVIVREYTCSLEIYRTNLSKFPETDILVGNFKFLANEKGVYNLNIKEAKIFDSLGVEIPFDTLNGGKIVVY